jgi:hypothetical protein
LDIAAMRTPSLFPNTRQSVVFAAGILCLDVARNTLTNKKRSLCIMENFTARGVADEGIA